MKFNCVSRKESVYSWSEGKIKVRLRVLETDNENNSLVKSSRLEIEIGEDSINLEEAELEQLAQLIALALKEGPFNAPS
jgi:hypothetical protein